MLPDPASDRFWRDGEEWLRCTGGCGEVFPVRRLAGVAQCEPFDIARDAEVPTIHVICDLCHEWGRLQTRTECMCCPDAPFVAMGCATCGTPHTRPCPYDVEAGHPDDEAVELCDDCNSLCSQNTQVYDDDDDDAGGGDGPEPPRDDAAPPSPASTQIYMSDDDAVDGERGVPEPPRDDDAHAALEVDAGADQGQDPVAHQDRARGDGQDPPHIQSIANTTAEHSRADETDQLSAGAITSHFVRPLGQTEGHSLPAPASPPHASSPPSRTRRAIGRPSYREARPYGTASQGGSRGQADSQSNTPSESQPDG